MYRVFSDLKSAKDCFFVYSKYMEDGLLNLLPISKLLLLVPGRSFGDFNDVKLTWRSGGALSHANGSISSGLEYILTTWRRLSAFEFIRKRRSAMFQNCVDFLYELFVVILVFRFSNFAFI